MRERCGSLSSYLSLLGSPVCSAGEPGVITWTPDEETPDVVYYQVRESWTTVRGVGVI